MFTSFVTIFYEMIFRQSISKEAINCGLAFMIQTFYNRIFISEVTDLQAFFGCFVT